MCRNMEIKFISWTYMYTTHKCLGKYVIQTNPSKFDERERKKETETDRQTVK